MFSVKNDESFKLKSKSLRYGGKLEASEKFEVTLCDNNTIVVQGTFALNTYGGY